MSLKRRSNPLAVAIHSFDVSTSSIIYEVGDQNRATSQKKRLSMIYGQVPVLKISRNFKTEVIQSDIQTSVDLKLNEDWGSNRPEVRLV